MAIKLNVSKKKQVVVPVRFDRACRGRVRRLFPDPDDRGFAMGRRPGGWSSSSARGAMVGICLGDTVTLRVRREDIDDSAKLFISSSAPAVLQVVTPVAGTPLPVNGHFQVKALQNVATALKLQVHFGTQTGPIIGDMEPHIFTRRTLRVRYHLVTINGTAPTRTAGSIPRLNRQVNDIWRQYGLQFRALGPVVTPIAGLTTAGTITTDLAGVNGPWQANEFARVLQLNPHPAAINVYCARRMVDPGSGWLGLTWDHDTPRPNGFGVAITDAASAKDLAHEIGHFFNLDNHIPGLNMWALRRLMAASWPPAAPAHRNNVGYTAGQYGVVVSMKNLPGDRRDNECARAQWRARSPF